MRITPRESLEEEFKRWLKGWGSTPLGLEAEFWSA